MEQTVVTEYAQALLRAHGEAALAEAAQRASDCEKKKDAEGAQDWRRVEAAIHALRGPRTS
jgi:hypothetical protein